MSAAATPAVQMEEACQPRWVQWATMILLAALLALMAARTMLSERPFTLRPLAETGALEQLPITQQIQFSNEIARTAAAVAIVILAACWAIIGLAGGKKFQIRYPLAWLCVIAISACLFVSAARANDKREAITTAVEQSTLLLSALLAMQLASTPWRRRLVLIVLVGLAGVQGVKGLYQVAVEIPETAAQWRQQAGAPLQGLAETQKTPEQRLLEQRIIERTSKGWFNLANPYGSMMIVLFLGAAGLAAQKWRTWATSRKLDAAADRAPPAKAGQISTALVAAALTTLLAVAAGASLLLTASKGAIAAGFLGSIAAIVIVVFNGWARRHWRLLTAATAGFLVLALAAVALYGIHRGGLPSASMQVRWQYWQASVDIFRHHPLRGVGPGNFPDIYLTHRHAGAEEEVKNPHNVIMQALTEYGLIGGILYLGLLVWMLLKLAAPAKPRAASAEQGPGEGSLPLSLLRERPALRSFSEAGGRGEGFSNSSPSGRGWPEGPGEGFSNSVLVLILIAALALTWRLVLTNYPNAATAIFDNWMVVLVFLPTLFIAAWAANSKGLGTLPAIALGCGLAGFFLHNLTEYALFLPGAAMIFYVGAGVLLAIKSSKIWRFSRFAAAPLAAGFAALAVIMIMTFLVPALRKNEAELAAAQAYQQADFATAERALAHAAAADPLDAGPLADQAAIEQRLADQPTNSKETAAAILSSAAQAMQEAVNRRPRHAEYRQELLEMRIASAMREANRPFLLDHVGDVSWAEGENENAVNYWRQFQQGRREEFARRIPNFAQEVDAVVSLDPQNARRLIGLAQLAWQAGQLDQIPPLLDQAQKADAALSPAAVMRLTEAEKAQVELLRKKVAAVQSTSSSSGN